jgi:hypothetical protein
MTDEKDQLGDMLESVSAEQMSTDPILRQAFTVALLASDLFVPVEQTEEEQEQAGGVSLQAVMIDEVAHVLLFSSQEKLGAFSGPGTRFARASGNAVLPSLRGSFAILNPGKKGRILAPEDIATILGEDVCGHEDHVHGPDCNHDH